jgi:hypothetical protein
VYSKSAFAVCVCSFFLLSEGLGQENLKIDKGLVDAATTDKKGFLHVVFTEVVGNARQKEGWLSPV